MTKAADEGRRRSVEISQSKQMMGVEICKKKQIQRQWQFFLRRPKQFFQGDQFFLGDQRLRERLPPIEYQVPVSFTHRRREATSKAQFRRLGLTSDPRNGCNQSSQKSANAVDKTRHVNNSTAFKRAHQERPDLVPSERCDGREEDRRSRRSVPKTRRGFVCRDRNGKAHLAGEVESKLSDKVVFEQCGETDRKSKPTKSEKHTMSENRPATVDGIICRCYTASVRHNQYPT